MKKNDNKLYILNFHDSINNYKYEDFLIGIFSSYERAEYIAKIYLETVSGFKDFNCKYNISTKNVVGKMDNLESVIMICGWNIDNEMNDIDIWESDLYVDVDDAKKAFSIAKANMKRQEWSIDTYKINDCHWCDGFVRV